MQHQFGINLHHSSSSLQPPPTRPAQRSLDDLHRQSKQLTKQLRQMRQARSDLRGSSSSSSALRDAITRCEASIRTLEQQNAELVERQHCPQQQAMDGLYPIVTRLQPILIQAASDEGEKEEEGSYWLHLFLVETSGKPGS
jgi:septal ring factor EnvC (AmiA/AmiB activator)